MLSALSTTQPYPYVALCGLLVKINVLIMSTWRGVEWSTWLYSSGSSLFSQPRLYIDILALLAWNLSYVALYDLGYMLNNPHGTRRIDLPHESISNSIYTMFNNLISDEYKMPSNMLK